MIINVKLRNTALSFSIDINQIVAEKLKIECEFFGDDIPIEGKTSMKRFALILKRLCDDDIKRKSVSFSDGSSFCEDLYLKMKEFAKNDASAFIGIIHIAQKWEFKSVEKYAGVIVHESVGVDPMFGDIAKSVLRDDQWEQLVPNIRKTLLKCAAAKMLDQEGMFEFPKFTSLHLDDLNAMRDEAWVLSAFELIAKEHAVMRRQLQLLMKSLGMMMDDWVGQIGRHHE